MGDDALLPALSLVRLECTYTLQEDLPYPVFHGSLWRGALGYALKGSICIYPDPFQRPCGACPLLERCAYPPLFEPKASPEESSGSSDDAPRPVIIEPPLGASRPLRAGQTIELGMVLLGPAALDIPAIIRAMALLGQQGLGKAETRARLTQVVATAGERRFPLWPVSEAGPLPIITREQLLAEAQQLPEEPTLHFLTPTRIKRAGTFVAVPDAESIVRALLRRVMALAAIYGEPWYPDTRGFITLGQQLQVDPDVDWRAATHFSTRQSRRMPLDGFEGALRLRGGLPPALRALLVLGSYVHVGKLASYGHGWYRIEG